MYSSGGRVNFQASPLLCLCSEPPSVPSHRPSLPQVYTIAFSGGGRGRGSSEEKALFRSVDSPSQTPGAPATPTPHPLPGRQHLINTARSSAPFPEGVCWDWGVGVGRRRGGTRIPGIPISKQQQNGFYISDVLVNTMKRRLRQFT